VYSDWTWLWKVTLIVLSSVRPLASLAASRVGPRSKLIAVAAVAASRTPDQPSKSPLNSVADPRRISTCGRNAVSMRWPSPKVSSKRRSVMPPSPEPLTVHSRLPPGASLSRMETDVRRLRPIAPVEDSVAITFSTKGGHHPGLQNARLWLRLR